MKKVVMITGISIAVVAAVGFVIISQIKSRMNPDQVILQYDKEIISEDKRALDFSPYGLDKFSKYDLLHNLVYEKSVQEIQQGILDGKFTVEDLCSYYLKRIELFQDYNAVIELNPHVMTEARALDKKIEQGTQGDLAGVIVMIKDNIASEKMHTSAGSYALKDLTTTRSAKVVQSLEAQDAIIIGKANLSEFSNYMSLPSSNGFSVLGGQTKNPYGKFDVGGSSSGPAVAAALNLATVTIGTETAGSIVIPSEQNSVVGLKPSMGLLSRDLIIPISEAMDTPGVIARSVKDVEKIFHAIVATDENDPATKAAATYDGTTRLDSNGLEGKVLGVYESDRGNLRMKAVIEEVQKAGATVKFIEADKAAESIDMMKVMSHGIRYDMDAFLRNPAVKSDIDSYEALISFYKSHPQKAPYGIYLLKSGLKSEADVTKVVKQNQTIARNVLDKQLASVDAMLCVSDGQVSPYSAAGYPAIMVPAGYKESGEPYGILLIAGQYQDAKLIELAYAYEANTSHRKALAR
jgi:amidase